MKKPKIGLLNLSDPLSRPLTALVEQLERQNVEVVLSPLLHDRQATSEQKAKQFNTWMKEDTFDIVFDVSGGDLANTTIPSLDLEAYAQSHTVFAGYSDLTPVLNVLAPIRKTLLYQIRNNGRFDELIDFLFKRNEDLVLYDSVCGGNIRCFLKLAGTPYFPDLRGRVLFLESYSGNERRIESFFAQLAQMGVFDRIDHLVLGNFSELFSHPEGRAALRRIAETYCKKEIIFDERIGHQHDSLAVWIS